MDMELKRGLRTKLLKYSEMYGLDDLVPSADTDGRDRGGTKEGWGFVKSWGWQATLSAQDVGVVVGAILEVGKQAVNTLQSGGWDRPPDQRETTDEDGVLEGEEWVGRFWDAYDALEKYVITTNFTFHTSNMILGWKSSKLRYRSRSIYTEPF
jgi:cell division control protein 45